MEGEKCPEPFGVPEVCQEIFPNDFTPLLHLELRQGLQGRTWGKMDNSGNPTRTPANFPLQSNLHRQDVPLEMPGLFLDPEIERKCGKLWNFSSFVGIWEEGEVVHPGNGLEGAGCHTQPHSQAEESQILLLPCLLFSLGHPYIYIYIWGFPVAASQDFCSSKLPELPPAGIRSPWEFGIGNSESQAVLLSCQTPTWNLLGSIGKLKGQTSGMQEFLELEHF